MDDSNQVSSSVIPSTSPAEAGALQHLQRGDSEQTSSPVIPMKTGIHPMTPNHHPIKSFLIGFLLILFCIALGLLISKLFPVLSLINPSQIPTPTTYDDCLKFPGSIIQESYPATCVTKDGLRFTQVLTDEERKNILPPAPAADWKTYTSIENNLYFMYPPDFDIVSADFNFIPAYNLSNPIIDLRKLGFTNKTSQYSQNANFVVSTSKDTTNCYVFDDNSSVVDIQTINSITYKTIKISNGATGHSIDGTIYRVINNKTCIEIETSIQSETGSGEGLDKLQASIQVDQEKLQVEMDQILSTFRLQ